MHSSRSSHFENSPRDSGDDTDEESEILEESPCGRWLKRREEVDQRVVPGIKCVHLSMDTEEGVEVVWNEMHLIKNADMKKHVRQMRQVFDNLMQLDHPNIVKFHHYWSDLKSENPRLIFITEYMSSGSMKQFLKRTKRNAKRLPLLAWRRWCTQILSALSYLHSCTPPIIHGNLSCDTIFIQHNGLVKIGSVVPDALQFNLKKNNDDDIECRPLTAPEFGRNLTSAIDVYAFGLCALEMGALEIQGDIIDHDERVLRTINSLESEMQRDLIFKCLKRNPDDRPSAHQLLFHPMIFEVPPLKLLSGHCLVFSPKNRTLFSETIIDEMIQRCSQPDVVLARIYSKGGEEICFHLSDVPPADKLEKFVEDVRFDVYPITAFAKKKPPPFRIRAISPDRTSSRSSSPEPIDIENRRIVNMMCNVKAKENSKDLSMTILLRMDDKMNRQLTSTVTKDDTAQGLTRELVKLGFVHVEDKEKICALLEDTLKGCFNATPQPTPKNSTVKNPSNGSGGKKSSNGSGGKKSSKNSTAATEHNWLDKDSPSNPTASITNNNRTPSSSGDKSTLSTPTTSSSQNTEQNMCQDPDLDNNLAEQQEQPSDTPTLTEVNFCKEQQQPTETTTDEPQDENPNSDFGSTADADEADGDSEQQ